MRATFAIIYIFLILVLALCGVLSQRSNKRVAQSVSNLLFSLIVPIIGNLVLVISENEFISTIGIYTFFLGMDITVIALMYFTFTYCNISWTKKWHKNLFWGAFLVDAIQYLLNTIFGQAFEVEQILVDNTAYYKFIPDIGQTYHRIIVYTVFFVCIITFLIKTIRTPKVYAEKYYIILLTLIAAGIWQSFYIFSGTPIDQSMIGFAISGILIFYFSLYFRPLKLLDRMLAKIASKIPEAVFFFDASNRCIWVNGNGYQLLNTDDKKLEDIPQKLDALFNDWGKDQENWSHKLATQWDNETRFFELEKRTVTDSKNHKVGSFLSIYDNTQEVKRHQREIYKATHDKLTDLYTKEFLFDKVHNQITQDPNNQYWIAYFDINDFKLINDIFGSATGDDVLKRVASWVRENATPTWVYGRLSGDAFGVCFASENPRIDLIENRLSKLVIKKENFNQKILMHLGLYKVTDPEIDVSIMFDRAHIALTTIKHEYNKHVAIYDDNMRDQAIWDKNISSQLERALEEKQICPYLQPIVDKSGKIIGSEALVRWIHPEEGFLPPIKFIPVFEKNGMIAEVDKFIWRSACEILASWKTQPDKKDLFISVNISPKDFYFMDVFYVIQNFIMEYDIDPKNLRIEITETVMMNESESRMAILNKFRKAGFIVEMDDFGSGYSSLNQLKDMPLDVLKIDMKFLGKSEDDKRATTILRNVIRLSDDLGLTSLTEGVETESQYKMLLEMGCHLFQGYFFAKPMPVKDFEELCAKQAKDSK